MNVQFVLQYSSVKNIIVNQEPANIHEVSLLKVCSILLNIDGSILNRNIRDNFQQEEKKEKRGENLSQVPYVKMHEVSIGSSEFM